MKVEGGNRTEQAKPEEASARRYYQRLLFRPSGQWCSSNFSCRYCLAATASRSSESGVKNLRSHLAQAAMAGTWPLYCKIRSFRSLLGIATGNIIQRAARHSRQLHDPNFFVYAPAVLLPSGPGLAPRSGPSGAYCHARRRFARTEPAIFLSPIAPRVYASASEVKQCVLNYALASCLLRDEPAFVFALCFFLIAPAKIFFTTLTGICWK